MNRYNNSTINNTQQQDQTGHNYDLNEIQIQIQNQNQNENNNNSSNKKQKYLPIFSKSLQVSDLPVHNTLNSEIDPYNPRKCPPDIKEAEDHGKAQRVGDSELRKEKENAQNFRKELTCCNCCGKLLNNNPLPLDIKIKDLFFLGMGFPLYFQFVMYCIIMLVVMFIIVGIFNISQNLSSNDCSNEVSSQIQLTWSTREICQKNIVTQTSLANKAAERSIDKYAIQSWVTMVCVIIFVVSNNAFRKIIRDKEDKFGQKILSAQNYTIKLKGLPQYKDVSDQELSLGLKKLLKEKWKEIVKNQKNGLFFRFKANRNQIPIQQKIEFEHISFSYDIHAYEELGRQRKLLDEKSFKLQLQKSCGRIDESVYDIKYNAISQKAKNLDLEIQKILDAGSEQIHTKTSRVAYVTFSSQYIADGFIHYCEENRLSKYVNNLRSKISSTFLVPSTRLKLNINSHECILTCSVAPQPEEIQWENAGVKDSKKFRRRIMTSFSTLVLLVGSFFIVLYIQFWYNDLTQKQYDTNYKDNKDTLFTFEMAEIAFYSLITSIMIVLINWFLKLIIVYFGKLEIHSTKSRYDISLAQKISVAQFVNTAIVVILSCIYVRNLWGYGGLVMQVFWIFIANIIWPPMWSFIDVPYIIKLYKRKVIKVEAAKNKSIHTQREANREFEGTPILMFEKYSQIIQMIWTAAFYTSVMPIGILISLIGIIISYWTDKYLLLRRHTRIWILGSELNDAMLQYLEFVPFFMSIGNILFHLLIYDNLTTGDLLPDIIGLCFGFVNIIFPAQLLYRLLFEEQQEKHNENYKLPYKQARFNPFYTDYDRENPVTKEEANKKWRLYFLEYILEKEKNQAHSQKEKNQYLRISTIYKNQVEQLNQSHKVSESLTSPKKNYHKQKTISALKYPDMSYYESPQQGSDGKAEYLLRKSTSIFQTSPARLQQSNAQNNNQIDDRNLKSFEDLDEMEYPNINHLQDNNNNDSHNVNQSPYSSNASPKLRRTFNRMDLSKHLDLYKSAFPLEGVGYQQQAMIDDEQLLEIIEQDINQNQSQLGQSIIMPVNILQGQNQTQNQNSLRTSESQQAFNYLNYFATLNNGTNTEHDNKYQLSESIILDNNIPSPHNGLKVIQEIFEYSDNETNINDVYKEHQPNKKKDIGHNLSKIHTDQSHDESPRSKKVNDELINQWNSQIAKINNPKTNSNNDTEHMINKVQHQDIDLQLDYTNGQNGIKDQNKIKKQI